MRKTVVRSIGRKLPLRAAFVSVILILVSVGSVSAVPVNSCGTLSTAGETYVLQNDISASGDCFTIGADDIMLDGAGYSITGDESSYDYGVYLNGRSGVTVKNLTVNGFWYGISIWASSSNTLKDNTMSANTYNFGVGGGSVSDYVQTIDTTNTVDGKPIYYLVGVSGQVIDASTNAGFVGIVNSNNVTVRDLTLTKNGQGMLFINTSNSSVLNVNASNNNYDGIHLRYSSNSNTITDNTVNSNGYYGISLWYSSNSNTITDNTVNSNDRYGILLDSSSSNNFITNNTRTTTMESTSSLPAATPSLTTPRRTTALESPSTPPAATPSTSTTS